jgi:transcriptional regulator with XRE-family HTH domain
MDKVVKAVRELRERLGLSQQEFAGRLKISIRAVAYYEKDRRPTGRSLVQLIRLAKVAKQHGAAAIFAGALREELGEEGAGFLSDYLSTARTSVLDASVTMARLYSTRLSPEQRSIIEDVHGRLSEISAYLGAADTSQAHGDLK